MRNANTNKNDNGFTLVELLVVCLIIAAIAWYVIPIFLDSVSTPNVIASMRQVFYAQDIFYQKQGKFTANAEDLYKSIQSDKVNVHRIDFHKFYQVAISDNALYLTFVPSEALSYIGKFPFRRWRSHRVRSYVGAIFAKGRDSTTQVICALNKPAKEVPNRPIFKDGKVTCSEGTFTIPETVKNIYEVKYPENP